MSSVYLFCLSLGFVFTVAGAVLGQLLGGGDHDHGGPGHDVDAHGGHGLDLHADHGVHAHGALDVGGGFDAPEFSHSYDAGGGHAGIGEGDVSGGEGGEGGEGGDTGSGHLPLFSPTVISFFLFMFGGTGLLLQRAIGISSPFIHVPIAAASAMASGFGLAWVLYKVTTGLESNRLARLSDALAAPAEVTISVPAQGMGEIAYLSAGTRQTLSARSADGREYRQGSTVRVLKVADGVALVGEASLRPAAIGEVTGGGEPGRGEPVRQKLRH
jgi:hypothetical protein